METAPCSGGLWGVARRAVGSVSGQARGLAVAAGSPRAWCGPWEVTRGFGRATRPPEVREALSVSFGKLVMIFIQAVRQMPAPKGLRPSGLPLGSEEWMLSRVSRRPQRPRGIRVHTTDLETPADS